MVPDLHEVHAVAVWQKGGIVAVKTLFLPHDTVPVAKVEVEAASGLHERVHLLQNAGDLAVRHIGKRVAGAHHAVEAAVKMRRQVAEIALPQVDGDATLVRLFAAAREHAAAQIGAVQRDAELPERQRERARPDAHIERRANGPAVENGLPVGEGLCILFRGVEEVVDVGAVVDAGHSECSS